MDGGLGRAIGGGEGERDKAEARGDRHDGSVRLLFEVRQQRGGEADGAEEVGGYDSFGIGCVGFVEEVFGAHDARVVDDDVEGGEVRDDFFREGADAGGVLDV